MEPKATTSQRRVVLVTVALGGALNIALLSALLHAGVRLNSDFLAFWSFPRFAAGHDPRLIYDAAALQRFQAALYPGFGSFYPYLYPPTLLLAISWLRFLPFGPAELVWTLAGAMLLAGAAALLFPRRRWAVLAGLLASPAALINMATGETAFFTAAFALAGLALLPKRPWLAGIAFGLLTLKPQLGVLIPFLLLARGEWRAILAAGAVAGGIAALSCIVLPPQMWTIWAQTLPRYQGQYFTASTLNLNIIATPAANLVVLGMAPRFALIIQALCGVVIAALIVRLARRAPYRLTAAALLTGTFLAQPHAYAYDSVLIPAALALCLEARPPLWALALGVIVYFAPLLLLSPISHGFLYAFPLAALFCAILHLARRARPGENWRHVPSRHPA